LLELSPETSITRRNGLLGNRVSSRNRWAPLIEVTPPNKGARSMAEAKRLRKSGAKASTHYR